MSRLVLIDGHAILHRAYHAYPPLTTAKGELMGAVYGFTSILLTVLKKLHPEYVAVAFDKKGPTFRHKKFAAYKIHRKPMDEELVNQLPRVHEVVEALNVPIFEIEGYEADDVIGTLAFQAKKWEVRGEKCDIEVGKTDTLNKGEFPIKSKNQKIPLQKSKKSHFPLPISKLEVVIVTGDQDALQLVDNQVKVYMPGRGREPEQVFDQQKILAKYGLEPPRIIELKALAGDASDGIPGVAGIGPKTATELIKKYQTLENIYGKLREIPETVAAKLKADKANAYLSQELATIDRQVPIKLAWDCCLLKDYDKEKVLKLFHELEFRSLIKKLPNDGWETMVEEIMNGKQGNAKAQKTNKDAKKGKQMGLF